MTERDQSQKTTEQNERLIDGGDTLITTEQDPDTDVQCGGCERTFEWAAFLPPEKENIAGTCPNCGSHILGFEKA